MPSSTITIKFINPPGPGKKNASIKDTTDDFYLLEPAIADKLSTGGTYNVDYRTNTFRGTTYKIVEKIEPVTASGGAAAQSNVVKGVFGGKVDDKIAAERIYVCGIVNNIMSNPGLNPDSLTKAYLVNMTQMARDAWQETFGRHNSDLNDENPF